METKNAEAIHKLVADGLHAVKAATVAGQDAAAKIMEHATDPRLKEELRRGTEQTATWQKRADTALQPLEGNAQSKEDGVLGSLAHTAQKLTGASDNRIIDAIYRTGKEISERAEDSQSRDLGIVATGQLALHYYVAAFGTLASYQEHLGHTGAAAELKQCGDEAKEADIRHTELAKQLLH